jgi:hypothetical protein
MASPSNVASRPAFISSSRCANGDSQRAHLWPALCRLFTHARGTPPARPGGSLHPWHVQSLCAARAQALPSLAYLWGNPGGSGPRRPAGRHSYGTAPCSLRAPGPTRRKSCKASAAAHDLPAVHHSCLARCAGAGSRRRSASWFWYTPSGCCPFALDGLGALPLACSGRPLRAPWLLAFQTPGMCCGPLSQGYPRDEAVPPDFRKRSTPKETLVGQKRGRRVHTDVSELRLSLDGKLCAGLS